MGGWVGHAVAPIPNVASMSLLHTLKVSTVSRFAVGTLTVATDSPSTLTQ